MLKNYILPLFATILMFVSGSQKVQSQNTVSGAELIEKKVDSVLALMTLQEKIGQMVQYNGSWDLTGPATDVSSKEKKKRLISGGVGSMLNVVSVKEVREAQKLVMEHTRLKIPLVIGYDVIHGFKTIFPIPLAEAASFNTDMMQRTAAVAASEASAYGIHWTFAPMIDISRDARWGRIMEGFGEDPFLTAQAGVAKVKGFQGDDLSKNNTIAACAKHFAGYGFAEAGRDYNTVNIGEHELNNIVLPPFKAVAKAGVATFMNSFNEIDGIPSTGNKMLQRQLLKGEWNWDGAVVSDWGSIVEMIDHGFAADEKEAAEKAILAGCDMDMESYVYESALEELIREGKVDQKLIDDAVKRILRLKFRLGLFDDPYRYCNEEREKNAVYTPENLKLAREAAKESIVLLKNEGAVLPLSPDIRKLAVIGPLAADKDAPLGNWRAQGEANSAVSVLEGIRNAVGKNTEILYSRGGKLIKEGPDIKRGFIWPLYFNNDDRSEIPAAVQAARSADAVVLVLGEDAYQSGEGRSQTQITLKGVQQDLLNAVTEVNKNVILVLMNGRPLDISDAAGKVPGILECWLLGSESGNAIADVLFGKYNPSGKLPVSFPYNVGQEPLYYNHKMTGRPHVSEMVTYSSYRDAPNTALFPFGFGLSYTTFKYENLKLDKKEIPADGSLTVSVKVTNTGDRDGEEVVQLYIRDLVGSITRPVKELKGFQKIFLKKGASKTVSFVIDRKLLEFYTIRKKWEVEPGDFEVWVGGDSTTELKTKFTVTD